jgi:hypothetical protein
MQSQKQPVKCIYTNTKEEMNMNIATVVKLDDVSFQVRGWYVAAEPDTGTQESLSIEAVFVGDGPDDIVDFLSGVTIRELEAEAIKNKGDY